MTTTAATMTAAPAHTATARSSAHHTTRVQGRQTFPHAVHAEWLKVWTLRSTWLTSAITVAITVLLGAGIAIAYIRLGDTEATARYAITAGLSFGQIAVAVLGTLVITGEYASGQIRSSLAAVPRRGQLLAAKAIVVAAVSFLLGVVSILLSWAISAPFLNGHAGSLLDAEYLGFFWGAGLSYAGIALMSMGLGFLMRSTAGSISVAMTLLFVLAIPLQILGEKWNWALKILGLLPASVQSAVVDPFSLVTTWGSTEPNAINFLEHWQAVAVFAAWAIVPVLAAWAVFSRRDA